MLEANYNQLQIDDKTINENLLEIKQIYDQISKRSQDEEIPKIKLKIYFKSHGYQETKESLEKIK